MSEKFEIPKEHLERALWPDPSEQPYEAQAEKLLTYLQSPVGTLHPEDQARIAAVMDELKINGDDIEMPAGFHPARWERMSREEKGFFEVGLQLVNPATKEPYLSWLSAPYDLREKYPLAIKKDTWKLIEPGPLSDPRFPRTVGKLVKPDIYVTSAGQAARWLTLTEPERTMVTDLQDRRARDKAAAVALENNSTQVTKETPFKPSWEKLTKPYDPPEEKLFDFLLSTKDVLHPEDEVRIGETIDMRRALGDDEAQSPRGITVREWEAMTLETQFFYAACLDPVTGKPGFNRRRDSLSSLRQQYPLEVEEVGSKPRMHNGWILDPRLERITKGTGSNGHWESSSYPQRRRWLTFTPAQRAAITKHYDEVVSKPYDGRHRAPETLDAFAIDDLEPEMSVAMAAVATESIDSDRRVEFVVPDSMGRRYRGRHFEVKRSLFGRKGTRPQAETLRGQRLPSRTLGYLGKLATGTVSTLREHLPGVRRPSRVIAALASVALLTAPASANNTHHKIGSESSRGHEASISQPALMNRIPAPASIDHQDAPAGPVIREQVKPKLQLPAHPETAYMAHGQNFWTLARQVLVAQGITHPTEYQILKKDRFIVVHNASVKPTEAPAGSYTVS